jgi:hypothetical protein
MSGRMEVWETKMGQKERLLQVGSRTNSVVGGYYDRVMSETWTDMPVSFHMSKFIE